MRGETTIIDYLNKALRRELTAVNQYWLHYRLLDKSPNEAAMSTPIDLSLAGPVRRFLRLIAI